ncbi:hypothetical protein KGQ34_01515 [Patescibacteria group bacterium]|nr:hypothetical protein [Patescibacteria group bacterium]
MRKLGFLSVSGFFFITVLADNAYPFDNPPFFEGNVQWNQTEKLRVELFGEYVIRSDIPVQYGKDKKYGKSPARHQEGVRLQYRLLDDPAIGKIEMNLSVRIDTRDDAPDGLHRGPVEVAYTLPKNWSLDFLRVRLGFSDQMNIGANAGSTREIGSAYVGADVKLIDTEKWLVSVNSTYHFSSNVPSKILTVYDGERKNPLRAEFGPQVYWRARPFITFVGAPSINVDSGFKPTMVGLKSGMQYDFGKQFFSPNSSASGFSWFIGEEWKINIAGLDRKAFQLTSGLRVRF